ncbi:MAG: PAS domain S-box protein, partial [Desulfonatronovibrio sp.]
MPRPSQKNQPNKNIFLDSQDILDNAPIGIIATSPDGQLLSVNPAMARMFGYDSPEELIKSVKGLNTQLYADLSDREELLRLLRENDEVLNFECRGVRKDKSTLWISINVNVVRDENGRIIHFQSFLTDISSRKIAEKDLLQSQERFALAMEASKDGLWDLDVTTGDIYCSPGLTSMLGYESIDVIKHVNNWKDLIHPEDRQKAYQANSDCLNNLTDSFKVEYRMKTRDGSWKWILGRGSAVQRDESGKALRMIGTHKDITRRKLAKKSLEEQEFFYRNVLASIDDALFLTDEHGNLTFVCPSAHVIFGRSEQDLLEMINIEHVLGSRLIESDELAADEQEVSNRECTIKDSLGNLRYLLVNIKRLPAILHENGVFLYCCRDVTEKKKIEDSFRQTLERYRLIVETANEGIRMLNKDAVITFVNESFCRMLGRKDHDLLGQSTWDLIDPLDHKKFSKIWNERESGKSGKYEIRMVHADGSIKLMLVSSTPRFDQEGNFVGSFAMLTDITDSKVAYIDNERFKLALDSSTDSFFIIDRPEMKFVDANEASWKSLGMTRKELLELGPHDIKPDVTKKDLEKIFDDLAADKQKSRTIETVHKGKNSLEFPVEVRIQSFVQDDREMLIAVARDVTEYKKNQEELTYRLKLQSLLMDISMVFLSVSSSHIDRAIDSSLMQVGEFTNADRVYIFKYDYENRLMFTTHEWCASGIEPQIHNLQNIPFDLCPEHIVQHNEGKPFYHELVEDMSDNDPMKAHLQSQ